MSTQRLSKINFVLLMMLQLLPCDLAQAYKSPLQSVSGSHVAPHMPIKSGTDCSPIKLRLLTAQERIKTKCFSTNQETTAPIQNQETNDSSSNQEPSNQETADPVAPSQSADFWVGIYNNKIKSSNNDSYDDINATVESLQQLGANFYGYAIGDGDLNATCSLTYDANNNAVRDYTSAGFEWCHFIELLEATKNTPIKIFAVIKEKHLSKSNRWLPANFYFDFNQDGSCSEHSAYTDSDTCNAFDATATKQAWLSSFTEAASTLSTLSVTYPNLVGFTVDDFDVYVCHPTNTKNCYTVAEVAQITAAAHSANKDFQFWPTIYQSTGVSKVIADGFVIGSRYGANRKAGDYAQMKLTLQLSEKPNQATVEFLWSDNNSKEQSDWSTYEVDKRLIVNGNTLLDAALWENDYIENVSEDLSDRLVSGENTIVLQTYFKTGLNAYHSALVFGSGLSVKINGEEIECSLTSSTCAMSFESLNQKPENENLYAETNDAYRITEAVDGILAVYQPAIDAVDQNLLASLLANTRFALGTKKFLHVSYGALWGKAIKANYLKEQLKLAAHSADGVLLWNPPLALLQPEDGIFAYRDSEVSGYELYSFWPQKMPGVQGWHQTFTSINLLSGTYTVDVIDNQISGEYFQKSITDSLGNTYYEEYCGNNMSKAESITVTLSSPAQLVLKVKETGGVGDVSNNVWFHIQDSDGNTVSADDFEFESTSEDEDTIDINTMLSSTLSTLSGQQLQM